MPRPFWQGSAVPLASWPRHVAGHKVGRDSRERLGRVLGALACIFPKKKGVSIPMGSSEWVPQFGF